MQLLPHVVAKSFAAAVQCTWLRQEERTATCSRGVVMLRILCGLLPVNESGIKGWD